MPQPPISNVDAVYNVAINFSQTNFLSLSICIPSNLRHDLMIVHDKEILNDANLKNDFPYSHEWRAYHDISFSCNGCVWNCSIEKCSAQISKPFQNNKCVTHFASLTTNSNLYTTIAP